jgi:hypothetical protein
VVVRSRRYIVFLYRVRRFVRRIPRVLSTVLVLIIVLFVFLGRKEGLGVADLIKKVYEKQVLAINSNICSKLIINGIKHANYGRIQNHINDYCSGNNMVIEVLKQKIIEDPWIRDLYIQRKFPNSLKIYIIEYNPFALLIGKDNSTQLIDEYGTVINIIQDDMTKFSHLLVITGDNFKSEINNLFNMLSIYYNIAENLAKIERVGNRRWNLVLKNNVIIKMPEENDDIFDAWIVLDKIFSIYGFDIDLREIDLRIKDKVFLKYKNNTAQEIKDFRS